MTPEELPILTLSGSPSRRGETHGEALREPIQRFYGGWARSVEKATGKPVADVAADFRASTRIEASMRRWTPGLLEELGGIARAANLPFAPFFMFNATDENEWFLKYRGYGLDLPEARGCSSACVEGESRFLGQNMDIPGVTEGYQVVFRIPAEDDGPEVLVVSLAGMLALMGMNSAPLGVVNNSLRQLNCRVDGLPVNVMVRALLEQRSLSEAMRFIQAAPHASGQNYILASDEGAAMFECSAAGAVEVQPTDGRLFHTNHPVASTDVNEDPRFNVNRSTSDTVVRLDDLAATLAAGQGLDALASALRSHRDPGNPVCRHLTDRRTNFSAASVIYDLGSSPSMHVVPGPPCECDYRQISFG